MMMIVLLRAGESSSDSGTQHYTDQQSLVHALQLIGGVVGNDDDEDCAVKSRRVRL